MRFVAHSANEVSYIKNSIVAFFFFLSSPFFRSFDFLQRRELVGLTAWRMNALVICVIIEVWNHERSERHFIERREKRIVPLEGSQTLPARPSNKTEVRISTK
jgi:hypothetical protein